MAHALLHDFQRKTEPAICRPVDEPGRIEVPQGVQAGVFRGHDRFTVLVLLVGRYGHAPTAIYFRGAMTPTNWPLPRPRYWVERDTDATWIAKSLGLQGFGKES